MKPTLFWKILGAFWLTIILAQTSTLLVFAAYTHWGRDVRNAIVAQRNERILTAQVALKYGGTTTLNWPPGPCDTCRPARASLGQVATT